MIWFSLEVPERDCKKPAMQEALAELFFSNLHPNAAKCATLAIMTDSKAKGIVLLFLSQMLFVTWC